MLTRVTTICCSAIALVLALPVVLLAQAPSSLASIFPIKRHWSLTLDEGLGGRPVFDRSRAYVPLAGDRLAAYDLLLGKQVWNVPQPAPAAMVAGEGRVFATAGTSLVAVDAESGQPGWQLTLDAPLTAVPVVTAGWLVLATAGSITALRADDGSLVWTQAVGGSTVHPPTVDGLRVYAALDDSRVIALRVQNGSIAWERRLGGAPQPVLARGDRLYVGAADNYFYSLRATDGQVLWRWRTGADIVGAAIPDASRVYFASMDNVLRGLDAGTGAQRWKTPLPLRPTSGPIAAGDTLLVAGLGPRVLGFEVKDGKPSGEFAAEGPLAAPPHVVTAPALLAPLIVLVTRSATSGTMVTALTRDFEPPARPLVPLPNPAPMERLPGEPARTPDDPDEGGTPTSAPAPSPEVGGVPPGGQAR